jgi:Fe-S-cluster containining protein
MRPFFKRQARPTALETPESNFSQVLSSAQEIKPGAESSNRTPLLEALEKARICLPKATNIGKTGDETDYYHVLDTLSDGVQKAFPESYCRSGCSGCCHYPVGLFTITFTEWNIMRRHMETVWSDADREDFVKRYKATFNGFWIFLLGFLQNSFPLLCLSTPWLRRSKVACPFLKDNRCSIYQARPYQCRTFGLFAARTWPFKQPRVYACDAQGENLLRALEATGPQVQLPVMNAIVSRIRALCRGPKQSLPLWSAAWVRRYKGSFLA